MFPVRVAKKQPAPDINAIDFETTLPKIIINWFKFLAKSFNLLSPLHLIFINDWSASLIVVSLITIL